MIFDELSKIYFEIDNKYAVTEAEARSRKHRKKEAIYSRKRGLNDQAYFLFIFSRFEDRIRQLSNQIIDRKYNSLSKWNYRRTWEVLYKRKNKIHLLDRVALLTPIGQKDYNLIYSYYEQRNMIAHGQSFTIIIDITTVVSNMQRLYYELE